MRYFDLHCDTITECFEHNLSLKSNNLHIDREHMDLFENYVQCYAVWLPDHLQGDAAFQYFCSVADRFSREISANSVSISLCARPGDLDKAENSGKHGAVLAVENASALGGRLENIAEFKRRGVKLCTLTWNGENELGRGVRASGKVGLTEFGRKVVTELERCGIITDLSHSSPELFADVMDIACRPVIATHSNAKSLCGHPRNLSDEQFLAVKNSGGLVGLNFVTFFLCDDPSKAGPEDILRHVEHFLALGGEDVIAFGADWDGSAPEHFPLGGLRDIPALYELFLRHYKQSLVDKIFYKNAANFFRRENLL